jgi:hypothetical protein
MAYQLVIFDWDGTVMDSTGRIIACMHQAGADLCLPVLEDDAVREIIGLGLPEALRTLYPGIDDGALARMRERYAVHFVAAEASPSCTRAPAKRWRRCAVPVCAWRWPPARAARAWTGCGPAVAWAIVLMRRAVPMKPTPSRTRRWSRNY